MMFQWQRSFIIDKLMRTQTFAKIHEHENIPITKSLLQCTSLQKLGTQETNKQLVHKSDACTDFCSLYIGLITINHPVVRLSFTLPTRGLKRVTLPTWGLKR
jgi:hypothetical protein